MSVEARTILDLLTEATKRYRQEGDRGISWVLDHMSNEERVAFDLYLVRTGDRLATVAGSMESRFRFKVEAMVELLDTGKIKELPLGWQVEYPSDEPEPVR